MISLKDNRLTTKKHGVVYCEEYVKEAVLKFEKEIDSHIKHCKKYKDIEGEEDLKYLKQKFKKIFGDFEK